MSVGNLLTLGILTGCAFKLENRIIWIVEKAPLSTYGLTDKLFDKFITKPISVQLSQGNFGYTRTYIHMHTLKLIYAHMCVHMVLYFC